LKTGEKNTHIRIVDLFAALPAITGKIELVYEGEQEGPGQVAHSLISRAIRTVFVQLFPDPEKIKRSKKANPYEQVIDWFNAGNSLDLMRYGSDHDYQKAIESVKGLKEVVKEYGKGIAAEDKLLYAEFVLHGLSEYSQLSRKRLDKGFAFKDMLGSLFSTQSFDDEEEFNN